MRVNTTPALVATAILLCSCLCSGGAARADDTQTPAVPQLTPRELTEDEEAILKKAVLLSSADPDEGPAPLTVQFLTESLDEDELVNPKYEWNFGDGSKQVHGKDVTHTYKKPGDYRAVVRVSDDNGMLGSDDVRITVQRPEKKK